MCHTRFIKVRILFIIFFILGLFFSCGGGGGGGDSGVGNSNGRGEAVFTVTSIDPPDGAADVPVDKPISIAFSQSVDPATVTSSNIAVSIEGNSMPGSLSCSGATVTFTPSPPLSQGTTFTVRVTTGVKDLAGHSLTSDHTWSFTTLVIVQPLGKWTDVVAGIDNGMALNENGTIWTWGCNYSGQLGIGTGGDMSEEHLYDSYERVQVGNSSDWQAISAGRHFMHAIKTSGALWAWGQGYLGNGTLPLKKYPAQIGSSFDWAFIDGGIAYLYVAAIKTDGTLWTWGNNAAGQLGDGTGGDGTDNHNSAKPLMIGSDTDWAFVSAGGNHTVALKENGTLWVWGGNEYGQLGDGTTVLKNTPVRIGTDSDWAVAVGGGRFTIAIKHSGTLWAWGINDTGQLGDGTIVNKNTPVRIGSDTDWSAVAAGYNHAVAIKRNGTLWAWGSNTYGQLGDGTGGDGSNSHDSNVPKQLGTSADWEKVSSGEDFTLALKTDGTLWSWGLNKFGRLGDGTNVDRNTPVQVK